MTDREDPSTSASEWPPVTFETLPWTSRLEPGMASRAQIRQHAGSYAAAIPPMIARQELRTSADLIALIGDASSEIARFDAELGTDIAPFATVLLRSESVASSQIENLTASARAIAEAVLTGRSGSGNAALIVANAQAMTAAIALASDLSEATILTMHRVLLQDSQPRIAGRWREEQVWICGSPIGPHRATFVPPHHSRIPLGITDLVTFLERDDLPVLAHAALAHAQFETIHPFVDGNGRTGRALIQAMLRGKSLTRNVSVPVSAGLLVNVDDYIAALDAYRIGNPRPIIEQIASAGFAAVTNGRQLVADLRDIRASWNDRIRVRRKARAWRIADLLISQPVINAHVAAAATGVTASNVYAALAPLIEAGVLVESTDRQRGRIWRSPEVLTALDDFAARAGKRGR